MKLPCELPLQPEYGAYLSEMEEGRRQGLIVYGDPSSPLVPEADQFAHLPVEGHPLAVGRGRGMLHYWNTRGLVAETRKLLEHLSEGRPIRFLDLGHGAGLACTQARRLAERKKRDIVIHAAGLQPVSPFRGLAKNVVEIAEALPESAILPEGMGELAAAADSFRQAARAVITKQNRVGLRLDVALALDARLKLGLFRAPKNGRPIIDRQYIGRMVEDYGGIPGGPYDLIQDAYGPLTHSENPDALTLAAASLAPEGALLITECKGKSPSGALVTSQGYRLCMRDMVAILLRSCERRNADACLLLRRDSAAAEKLAATLKPRPAPGGFYIADSLQTVLRHL